MMQPEPVTLQIRNKNRCITEFSLPVRGKEYRAGREPNNDIVIADEKVSRYHFTVSRGWDDAIVLTDLGGTNGVTVNGIRIRDRIAIEPGDTVRVGDLDLVLIKSSGTNQQDAALQTGSETDPEPDHRVYVALLIGGCILVFSALLMILITLFH
jgi:pSer/pThr/pTyr-binding forkhead associated (FHA) protein